MDGLWPQIALVAGLVLLNGVLAGSEIALISLRESQVRRLERSGRAGKTLADLVRDPNRFLATIQIGITLSGFLASAAAAVTLAEPIVPRLEFMGTAAEPVAVVAVTLLLSYFTLVFGELVPKRLALQRSETWSLLVGRPIHLMAVAAKPVVWLLSVSTDLVVRLFGGEPGTRQEAVDLQEVKEIVLSDRVLSEHHQDVLVGAVEVADRTLREVFVPRPNVFVLTSDTPAADAIRELLAAGHSRAPVAPESELDDAIGIAHLRDLAGADPRARVGSLIREMETFPESMPVLNALRRMQQLRQQITLVVDEFGGIAGLITVEDLVEELVGEIYDESDRDVTAARHEGDEVVVPGGFPVHDLVDVGIDAPGGDFTTVAGLVLDRLGTFPEGPGTRVVIPGWEVIVVSVRRRRIEEVRFRPLPGDLDEDG